MKQVCLGSAMWGWSVDESDVLHILDHFYQSGYRYIDVAWNYPINGNEDDLSLGCRILAKWLEKTGVKDLKILFKMGAEDNSGGVDNNLSTENLRCQVDEAKVWFGSNLHCAMIHWDRRREPADIHATVEFLKLVHSEGVRVGLSGIAHPEIYVDALGSYASGVYIQAKHNVIQSDIHKYSDFLKLGAKFFSYGISGSGLKISEDEYRKDSYVALVRDENFHQRMLTAEKKRFLERVIRKNDALENLYHVGIAYSEMHPDVCGYIISPSRYEQLVDSLIFIANCDFTKLELEGF